MASDADVQRSALKRRPRRADQAQYVGVTGGGSFAEDGDLVGLGSGHAAQPSQKTLIGNGNSSWFEDRYRKMENVWIVRIVTLYVCTYETVLCYSL